MDARRWVASRKPAAPPALAERIDRALAAVSGAPNDVAEACLRAAEATLAGVLVDGATARASALDLLAADALATYAFEAASDTPERLGALAHDAMTRLSALTLSSLAGAS